MWWRKAFSLTIVTKELYLQEGRVKRNEGKKETKSSDAEDDKPEEPIKRKTGGFKGMQKTFGQKFSPKMQRKKSKASVAMMKVFPNELESQKEFDGFTEWLQTFELYRGKQVWEI